MSRTVLFFHPGKLGDFIAGRRPWRAANADHNRAFLRSIGAAVTSLEPRLEVARRGLTFWGEWESDAWGHAMFGVPHTKGVPGCYLEPRPQRRASYSGLHNTESFVFGGPFLYSNCMQAAFPSALGDLRPGDIVLFGSNVANRFALDTVLVIAERHDYHPATWAEDLPPHLLRPSFEVATLGPLSSASGGECSAPPNKHFTLFVGATPQRPRSDGAFSFVPAKLTSEEPPTFQRPNILDTKQNEGVAGDVPVHWLEVARRVLDSGLVLATAFDEPPTS